MYLRRILEIRVNLKISPLLRILKTYKQGFLSSSLDKRLLCITGNVCKFWQDGDIITTKLYKKWQLSSAHTFQQKLQMEQLFKELVTISKSRKRANGIRKRQFQLPLIMVKKFESSLIIECYK